MNKEVNEKKKRYAIIISFLVLMVCVTGGTYAYFALTASNNSITGTVGGASLNLTVSKVYPTSEHNNKNMIPQLESTLGDAISDEYNCVDDNGNVICQVYSATVTNVGSISSELNGTIKFEGISNMPNLKWKRITDSRTIGEYSSNNATTSEALFEEGKVFNANETATYYFVFWIDETGEVQTDSGTFRSIIEFDSSTGGLTSTIRPSSTLSAVVLSILEDNPVQETIEGMFNYTSEGESRYNGANSTYVTNGMYMMEDEDGESYYFRGNVDNIVQFGSYENDYYVYQDEDGNHHQTLETCQATNRSCSESNKVLKYAKGTPMYWRIVRINGDGTLRLLYSGTSKDATGNDLIIGYSQYNSNSNDKKYTGYTYDNGTDSLIKKEVDEWYKNAFSTSSYDKYVAEGRFCSDSTGFDQEVYDSDGEECFASYDRIWEGNPTLICPQTTETFGGSYILKAGLMTVDEMMLAGDARLESSNNYLSSTEFLISWTMTPEQFGSFDYGDNAFVWSNSYQLDVDAASYEHGVRPVINLLTDNGLALTGSGTTDEPYVLSPAS